VTYSLLPYCRNRKPMLSGQANRENHSLLQALLSGTVPLLPTSLMIAPNGEGRCAHMERAPHLCFKSYLVLLATRGWPILQLLALILLSGGCAPAETLPPTNRVEAIKEEKTNSKVIVFVHGIFGNAEHTWQSRADGPGWPQMVAKDPNFSEYNVVITNYESNYFARSSTVEEIAVRMLQQLDDHGIFRYEQIHLITHSMGGLIAKRMLISMNHNNPESVAKLRRVRSILLIGTPSQGSDLSALAVWLSTNPQLKDMTPADLNSFLQVLENDWKNFYDDRVRITANLPRVYCGYETKSSFYVADVVPRMFANTLCDNKLYPMDLDHIHVVKPESTRHDPYAWGSHRIREAADLRAELGLDSLPMNDQQLFRDARRLAEDQQHARAADILGELVKRYPRESILRHAYGTVLSMNPHKRQVAVDELREAKKLNPSDARILFNLGATLQEVADLQHAETELRGALEIAPRHYNAMFRLASIYYETGRYDEAIDLYTRVINQVGDGIANAYLWRAEAKLKRNPDDVLSVKKALEDVKGSVAEARLVGDSRLRSLLKRICEDANTPKDPLHSLSKTVGFRSFMRDQKEFLPAGCKQ
jgi:tetratricopeptide (TPR) repeat protein